MESRLFPNELHTDHEPSRRSGTLASAGDITGEHPFSVTNERCMESLQSQKMVVHGDHEPCSADFQSAVSRISNPQAGKHYLGAGMVHGLPTGSRRYGRLETCATRSRFMERRPGSPCRSCRVDPASRLLQNQPASRAPCPGGPHPGRRGGTKGCSCPNSRIRSL